MPSSAFEVEAVELISRGRRRLGIMDGGGSCAALSKVFSSPPEDHRSSLVVPNLAARGHPGLRRKPYDFRVIRIVAVPHFVGPSNSTPSSPNSF